VTSNSWLDVGYGADLQEFLLKHSHVKMVLDNQVRRTFAGADVNTIIALLSSADDGSDWGVDKTARFVMFRVPYEQVVSPVIFDEIEAATERRATPEYRIFPIKQDKLLADGCEIPEEEEAGHNKISGPLIKVAHYIGNKWGGKYLRAPDIYWRILEKGKGKLVRLGDIFDGERYLNTGGADGFFIINKAKRTNKGCFIIYNNAAIGKNEPYVGEIEEQYLFPLIKDYTKDNKRIEIGGYDAFCIVIGDNPTPKAKEYIKWGERQGYHLRSVTKTQKPWYRPTRQMLASARILVPRSFNNTYVIHYNPRNYLSLRFYRLHIKQGDELILVAWLNSALLSLFIETLGNRSLGQGVLDFFMADFLELRVPLVFDDKLKGVIKQIKDIPIRPVDKEYGLNTDPIKGTISWNPSTEREALDGIVFDSIGLSCNERSDVYEGIINLVEARLKKADSV